MMAYAKAYAALVGGLATALLGIYATDSDVGKWLTVIAGVATAVATFAVPNLDPQGVKQDESVQPPNRGGGQMGYGAIELLVFVVVLIVVVWLLIALINHI